jgi:hypothetical protein
MKEEINKDSEILKNNQSEITQYSKFKNLNWKLGEEWNKLKIEYQELKTK